MDIREQVKKARSASYELAHLSSEIKNKALTAMADVLDNNSKALIAENKKDLRLARGLQKAFIERLTLTGARIRQMSDSLRQVSNLKDPIGEVIGGALRPNGLWIQKVRVSIGVIAIIYESRPNVTSDCIGLCLKSANACILRGGSEALNTNRMIYRVLSAAAKKYSIPDGAISFIGTPSRDALNQLLKLNDYVDLVIPRGGEGLIRFVDKYSRIPVIKHYKGICHIYVDEFADLNMAENICFNAKVQRPGVCNAMETLLVHKDIAMRFLPLMARRYKSSGVEMRGCPLTLKILKGIKKASEVDWRTEYLDLILSIKVVQDAACAIQHINDYGSHHSDSIITDSYQSALDFMKQVDSACVYVNASTRFTDGYQFGMGAEIGISTDKIHARGPMALEELTTYKYVIFGNGQTRE